MEIDPAWTFDQYQAYERKRLLRSQEEQDGAIADGLDTDPKSVPHGGYRIACSWPEEVTGPAWRLSEQLARLLPGTPPYPYDSIHSSVGNARVPDDRFVDPDLPDDRKMLDGLTEAVRAALASARPDGRCQARFGPALLAPRMALVFGRPDEQYWGLQRAIHAAVADADLKLEPSWGPHLTLTRFGRPEGPERAARALELLSSWRPVSAAPAEILVGYYQVAPGSFKVTTYTSFDLR